MTDDIVTRLRTCSSSLRSHYTVGAVERIPAWTMDEAADEIERLRQALRSIIGTLEDPRGGQHVADMRAATNIARAALAEQEDQP